MISMLKQTVVILMPPGEPAVIGTEVGRSWAQDFFDQFTVQDAATSEEIVVAGNWAFQRLSFTLTLTPAAGGDPIQLDAPRVSTSVSGKATAPGSSLATFGTTRTRRPAPNSLVLTSLKRIGVEERAEERVCCMERNDTDPCRANGLLRRENTVADCSPHRPSIAIT